jgi:hypothetical protein
MGEMHTVSNMRRGALWLPLLSAPVKGGGQQEGDFLTRARTRAAHLLRTHVVEPLSSSTLQSLDEIMQEARRELAPAAG